MQSLLRLPHLAFSLVHISAVLEGVFCEVALTQGVYSLEASLASHGINRDFSGSLPTQKIVPNVEPWPICLLAKQMFAVYAILTHQTPPSFGNLSKQKITQKIIKVNISPRRSSSGGGAQIFLAKFSTLSSLKI
ncbi:MAG: hypothetical protein Q8Q32_02960 [bacterium]|nr:hypothetical protein [bacterium]